MSRQGNCTYCIKPWHDGMTCDFAAGYREARAEIVAKLRKRAQTLKAAGEMKGSTLITDAALLAATQLENLATELEVGCP